MAKYDQSSIKKPTEEELIIYNKLVPDISEAQLDEMANEYFYEVAENNLDISFPKFIINKMIRPIKASDTININVEEKILTLYCLMRKEVDGIDYLLFAEADESGEALREDFTYLLYVAGLDEIGIEEIDFVPHGELSNKILDLMEAEIDAEEITKSILGKEE